MTADVAEAPRWIRIEASLTAKEPVIAGVDRVDVALLLVLDATGALTVQSAALQPTYEGTEGQAKLSATVLDKGRVTLARDQQGRLRGVELLGRYGPKRLPEYFGLARGEAALVELHEAGMHLWREVEHARDRVVEVVTEAEGGLLATPWTHERRRLIAHMLFTVLSYLHEVEPASDRPSKTERKKAKKLSGRPTARTGRWSLVSSVA